MKAKSSRKYLRFSLRSWFVFLAVICVGLVVGNIASKRKSLERQIVSDGTLIYGDLKRHDRPIILLDGGGLGSRQVVESSPAPVITMRDSIFPWLGKCFEGSPMVCRFDSLEYHVGNVLSLIHI